jgi:ABC-type multidrug transport system permease subunit
MEYSAPEILSSIFCILLVILASVIPNLFPSFSISWTVSLCDLFIVSIPIFRSLTVLFNYCIYLVVFSCNSSKDFCIFFKGFYLFTCVLL